MKTTLTTTTIDSGPSDLRRSRGVAITDLLIILAILGSVGLSVVIVSPRILRGQSVGQFDTSLDPSTTAVQLDAIIKLELLCKTSRATLGAVSSPADANQIQWLIVWTADDAYPERVDLAEVVVLRHSTTLRSLFVYAFIGPSEENGAIDLKRVKDSGYLEQLVAGPHMEMKVAASGLQGLGAVTARDELIRPVQLNQRSEAARLRLTWGADSAEDPLVSLLRADLPAGYLAR